MQQATKEEWLRGVKCIADFLGVDERTVRRWAKGRVRGFPIQRIGGRWVAHTGELRAWMNPAAA
jgi:predicted transcriptional regulator